MHIHCCCKYILLYFSCWGLFQGCIWMSTNLSVGRLCLTFLHDIAAKAYKYSGVAGHWGFSFVYLGRLPKVDLIILEGEKCPYVRPSVRPYVRPSTKSFFDFNEIWYIGRGRWVMHDGMPYDPIQGQGQGHEPLKVWIPSIFKTYLLRHLQWQVTTNSYLKLEHNI